jgi:hypothetical protein
MSYHYVPFETVVAIHWGWGLIAGWLASYGILSSYKEYQIAYRLILIYDRIIQETTPGM